MSWFIPTTTVTIFRGETYDDNFGDLAVRNNVVASGVPAAIATKSNNSQDAQRSFEPSSDRGGVVEKYTVRMRPNVSVEENDRLFDERFGLFYLVVSVFNPQSVVGAADVRVLAKRVGASSRPVNG